MRTMARWVIGFLAAIGVLAVGGAIDFARRGLSSRTEPPNAEVTLARAARHFLIPAAARQTRNPLEGTPELHATAKRHWADHCASCHGNDGKGGTAMGQSLYPRAPDMTLPPTQRLSDGELFWIIENGIKLTGMPAWGTPTPGDEAESWELVHLIRKLPALTPEELLEMKRMNPISRAEFEEELQMERFLAGEDEPSTGPARSHVRPPAFHHP